MVQGKQNVKAACPKDKLDVFSNPDNAHLYFGCNVNFKISRPYKFTICTYLNLENKFWFHLEEQFPRVLNLTGTITIKKYFSLEKKCWLKITWLEHNVWLGNGKKTALQASNGIFFGKSLWLDGWLMLHNAARLLIIFYNATLVYLHWKFLILMLFITFYSSLTFQVSSKLTWNLRWFATVI